MWESNLSLNYYRKISDANDEKDDFHPDDLLRNHQDGRRYSASWQNDFRFFEFNIFTAGIEFVEDQSISSLYSESMWGPYENSTDLVKANTKSIFLQDQIDLQNGFFAAAGLRYDNHSSFGNQFTYKIAPSYIISYTNTKLKASYGTGFKAPSLFYIFDPLFGNPELKAEKNSGWDAGFEQYVMNDQIIFGVTYFRLDFDNMIGFDENFKPINVAKAKSYGIEAELAILDLYDFSLRANYVYNVTNDISDDNPNKEDQLIRRPKNSITFSLRHNYQDKLFSILTVKHTGERFDNDYSDWTPQRVSLKAYTIIDLAFSYKILEFLTLQARAENLLNTEYEEVLFYGTYGRGFYGGIILNF